MVKRNIAILVGAIALVAAAVYYVVQAEHSYAECLSTAGNHVMLCQLIRPFWR
jgi:hypothetical protein